MTLTFLDSGPLIAFATGQNDLAQRVWDLIKDPQRTFVSTSLVRMEVLPKAMYHQNADEVDIYKDFFAAVEKMLPIDEEFIGRAAERAAKLGLNALDALHLEAAISLGADEFITTEKPSKPLFRETQIQVKKL